MKPTERGLSNIISDIFVFETYSLDEFELVIDQVIMCPLHDKPDMEWTELATTRHPFIIEAIVEGGKSTNSYEVRIQPQRKAVR